MHSRLDKLLKNIATFLVFAAFGVAVAACGHSAGANAVSEPASFNGSWTAKINDTSLVAIITGEGIEINWTRDETTALYWKGSFSVPLNAGDTLVITSTGDTETMANSMLASQDAVKVFTYQHGSLDFELRIAGVTQKVHMKRSSDDPQ